MGLKAIMLGWYWAEAIFKTRFGLMPQICSDCNERSSDTALHVSDL